MSENRHAAVGGRREDVKKKRHEEDWKGREEAINDTPSHTTPQAHTPHHTLHHPHYIYSVWLIVTRSIILTGDKHITHIYTPTHKSTTR